MYDSAVETECNHERRRVNFTARSNAAGRPAAAGASGAGSRRLLRAATSAKCGERRTAATRISERDTQRIVGSDRSRSLHGLRCGRADIRIWRRDLRGDWSGHSCWTDNGAAQGSVGRRRGPQQLGRPDVNIVRGVRPRRLSRDTGFAERSVLRLNRQQRGVAAGLR